MEHRNFKDWDLAAEDMEIKEKAYSPEARLIEGPYSFAIFYNPVRNERPISGKSECNLCYAVQEAELSPQRVIERSMNFIVTPNKFPTMRGSSIAINTKHIPLYRTNDLSGFVELMDEYTEIAILTDTQMFHNSPGAGSSIPMHEHSNFHNFFSVYSRLGKAYGFAGSMLNPVKGVNGVEQIEGFPFAHTVFMADFERIEYFLKKLHKNIGSNFEGRGVPHLIAQNENKLLVVPVKVYVEGKGTGAGDVAGHILARSRNEFETADWNNCIQRLGETLFKKDELNLEHIL